MKYDIIGDIHGCFDELLELLAKLGYKKEQEVYIHPGGRQLVFVGDAMDRGPKSLEVLQLLFKMQDRGILFYSPGNHCNKLYRYFKGNNVQVNNGLETTLAEWRTLPKKEQQEFRSRYRRFYEKLPIYQELGKELIVAHAGIKAEMIGKPLSRNIAVFVLYGDITGRFDVDGRPIRKNWAKSYNGSKWIVYGHTPTEQPYLIHQTANIDTGCVFGGALTAFRFPEKELVSVASHQPYQPDRFHRFT
ncbi:bis(5'-nucleosyl)-tetraphosphatase PrpE [Planococcus shenhongbingii]|uniref:Bis(5'-nucleosyl)-tetraphosphatase PrpE n=1 Tax=Planococcus shenhongbingii TaxID=3058398 RepID=A0ABT8NA01_9BACL|nr:bis(5'-nucleosyl)-tetraphosphatase PrpE [Planococcus sp. N017]MDN7244385.1 bis(5'-nucleosyl)-tetraphosphatase PrpE [Planococcus sp. N017]